MFELTQLRCFVAIAEELHFGRAANRLNMTQSPLSRQLQNLEHVMGAELVERSRRVVKLTPVGKVFLIDARAILRASEEAMLTARRVAQGNGGVVTLGFIPATTYKLLPLLVAFAAAEMPHVQLVLKEMVTADQAEALRAGRIDAGILRLPVDQRGMEMVSISRDEFIVAVPANKPLSAGKTLTIKDLDRQPLVMYAPTESRYHYDLITSVFRMGGIAPNFVQYAREIHTMLALVGAGIGVALVPQVAGDLGFPNVRLQPITLQPKVFSELTLIWRKQIDNPALRVFVETVVPRFLETLEQPS